MTPIGRYELKYVIDPEKRNRFLQSTRHGLSPDPHGKDAVYRVSSVYFDTPDYAAYWEKIDGEAIRRKYRLRFYSIDPSAETIGGAFMEIKHRINNTVYKQRLKLTNSGALAILQDARLLSSIEDYIDSSSERDRAALCDIQRAAKGGLEAKATITYLREAWIGKVDDRLRVTFDTRGQSYAPLMFANVEANEGQEFMPSNQTIMEVKFNTSIPRWIRDVLVRENLVLQRFSKYAAGVAVPARQYMKSLQTKPQEDETQKPAPFPAVALQTEELPVEIPTLF